MRSLCILVHSYATGTAHRHALLCRQTDTRGQSGDEREDHWRLKAVASATLKPNSVRLEDVNNAQFVHSGARLCDRDCAQTCTSGRQTDTCGRSGDEPEDHGRLKAAVSATRKPNSARSEDVNKCAVCAFWCTVMRPGLRTGMHFRKSQPTLAAIRRRAGRPWAAQSCRQRHPTRVTVSSTANLFRVCRNVGLLFTGGDIDRSGRASGGPNGPAVLPAQASGLGQRPYKIETLEGQRPGPLDRARSDLGNPATLRRW